MTEMVVRLCEYNCGNPAKMIDDHGKWFCSIECAAGYNLNRLHKILQREMK
jgi:hypothetical protein